MVTIRKATAHTWAWVYRGDGFELESNEDYGSPEDARSSAEIAYPGVPIRIAPEAVDHQEEPAGVQISRRRELLKAAAGVAAVAAGAAAILAWRRWRSSGDETAG